MIFIRTKSAESRLKTYIEISLVNFSRGKCHEFLLVLTLFFLRLRRTEIERHELADDEGYTIASGGSSTG